MCRVKKFDLHFNLGFTFLKILIFYITCFVLHLLTNFDNYFGKVVQNALDFLIFWGTIGTSGVHKLKIDPQKYAHKNVCQLLWSRSLINKHAIFFCHPIGFLAHDSWQTNISWSKHCCDRRPVFLNTIFGPSGSKSLEKIRSRDSGIVLAHTMYKSRTKLNLLGEVAEILADMS